ncbi:hypothetical protein [Streptomyces lydicamycinicus]|uniref:hypothetical protein n=1 Tax=Streptomyces lydicamycinicus TaxID=1546107 RepID=UPI003C2C67DD
MPHWEALAKDLLGAHKGDRTLAQDHWVRWVRKCQGLQKIMDLPRRQQVEKAEMCAWVGFASTIELRDECLVCAGVPDEVLGLMERWLDA